MARGKPKKSNWSTSELSFDGAITIICAILGILAVNANLAWWGRCLLDLGGFSLLLLLAARIPYETPIKLLVGFFGVAAFVLLTWRPIWEGYWGRTNSTDRIIVDVTPEYLMGLYRANIELQADRLASPYLGKWMKISGSVDDVKENTIPFFSDVVVYVWYPEDKGKALMALTFDYQWLDRLNILQRQSVITATCQLDRIIKIGIFYKNCELSKPD